MDYNQRFVVLDIETTGLTYEYFDEPTEIALIEIKDKKITGINKHYYLKPYKKVTIQFLEKVFGKKIMKDTKTSSLDEALNIADKNKNELLKKEILDAKNYASEMLKNISNGKSKYSILPEIRKFIGDSIVIAHNADFDINFLNCYFVQLGLEPINNYICTFKSFKEYFGFKKNTLTDCCNYYKITLNGAHNALEDTQACAELFLKEIEDFPNNILFFSFSRIESYVNFKKRVVNSTYFKLSKLVLEDTSFASENIIVDDEIEKECYNLFYNFNKPMQVSNKLRIDLYTTQSLFLKWANCININKHLDLVRDKNLSSFTKEVLNFCKRDYNQIRELNLLLFNKEPNYFIYKLYDKLENKKSFMEYDMNDLDYYFENLYQIDLLDKKIEKGTDYIFDKLFVWINNEEKLSRYENFIKDNYKKTSKIGISLTKSIDNSLNKEFILSIFK